VKPSVRWILTNISEGTVDPIVNLVDGGSSETSIGFKILVSSETCIINRADVGLSQSLWPLGALGAPSLNSYTALSALSV